jgi:uncharacterized protein YyaL (SSP411 family)
LKKLYDNAQLVSLYSHAYQSTKNPLYKTIVYETLDFIEKLTAPGGGFYSSLDAVSEGEEGKYYVWTAEELTAILGQEAPYFLIIITVQKMVGRQKNILFRKSADKAIATKYKISLETLDRKIKESS